MQGEHGPSGTEAVGLAATVVVLLFTFGSVFAMLVPLLTAVLAAMTLLPALLAVFGAGWTGSRSAGSARWLPRAAPPPNRLVTK